MREPAYARYGFAARDLRPSPKERQIREKLGSIIAAIGAELVAVEEAPDRLSDKTAWLLWLKEHVHYSADTAQNYMRVARFAEKNRSVSVFSGAGAHRSASPRRVARRTGRHTHARYPVDRPTDRAAGAGRGADRTQPQAAQRAESAPLPEPNRPRAALAVWPEMPAVSQEDRLEERLTVQGQFFRWRGAAR
jgi:hypothetical protein